MPFGSVDNQLHIFNNTSEKVYVMVTPNPHWAWGDLAFSIALTAVSMGIGGAPAAGNAATTANAVKDASTLQKLIQGIGAILSSPPVKLGGYYKKSYDLGKNIRLELDMHDMERARADQQKVKNWLEKEGVVLNPGEVKKVSDVENWNPLRMITPSGWGALFGASDVALFIATESFSRTALFNTNSDWSWIVQPDMVVRTKYGTPRQPSRADGFYRFSMSDRLLAGGSLLPGQCLSSSNKNHDLVYEGNGDLVLYNRDQKPTGERVVWSTETAQRPASRVSLQEDGNLVVYEAQGKAGWSSGRLGSGPDFELSSLVLEDSGELVIYDRNHQPVRLVTKESGPLWSPQSRVPFGGTTHAPRWTPFNGKLWMAWKGSADDGIWYCPFDGQQWPGQTRIAGVGTSAPPALAVHEGTLYMAWRGVNADAGLWYATNSGGGWSAQKPVPGTGTSHGPALASFGGKLWMVWKGVGDDGIWYSTFNGQSWASQTRITGVGTSVAPALAAHGGLLHMAWRGVNADAGLWCATNNGGGWAEQKKVPWAGTSHGPALASFGDTLWMVWKGVGDDNIWRSTYTSATGWTKQSLNPRVATNDSPTLAVLGDRVHMAWSGIGHDGLWTASFVPEPK